MKSFETIISEAIVGYSAYSDIELTAVGEGFAEGKIEITDHHLNPSGAVHGGTIFCLADVIGGIAAYNLGCLPTTLNSNISFMRPLINDKVITCRADVIKRGKTTVFVEAKVFNEQMTEAARLVATYYDLNDRVSQDKK